MFLWLENPMAVDRQTTEPNSATTRRQFLAGSAGGMIATAASATNRAEAQTVNRAPLTGSTAWEQPGNNEHMRGLRSIPGTSTGLVTIEYYGHCAFKITSPAGLTMMFDPWRNDPSGAFGWWFGRPFPRSVVDVCLSTHTHFDHDNLYAIDATTVLDRAIGVWSYADVTITGVADKHAISGRGYLDFIDAIKESGATPYPPNNPGHLDMVTFVVETGGMRILIWGDNRHNPPEEVWSRWGQIDVLTLPVDASSHVLNYDQANAVVARLKPRIVIPTHYLIEGTSLAISVLRTADEWVAAQPKKRTLTSPKLTLGAAEVATMDRDVLYFASNVELGTPHANAAKSRMGMAPG